MSPQEKALLQHLRERFPHLSESEITESYDNLMALARFTVRKFKESAQTHRTLTDRETHDTMEGN